MLDRVTCVDLLDIEILVLGMRSEDQFAWYFLHFDGSDNIAALVSFSIEVFVEVCLFLPHAQASSSRGAQLHPQLAVSNVASYN